MWDGRMQKLESLDTIFQFQSAKYNILTYYSEYWYDQKVKKSNHFFFKKGKKEEHRHGFDLHAYDPKS